LARFDALRKWRSETARARDVQPDIVLPNSTLLTIAQRNPANEAELATIVELGDWKVQTYGRHILATLNAQSSRRGR
jgi:ribonuclease D